MTTTTEPTTTLALTHRQIAELLVSVSDRLDKLGQFSHHPSAADAIERHVALLDSIDALLRQANARLPRDSERTK